MENWAGKWLCLLVLIDIVAKIP